MAEKLTLVIHYDLKADSFTHETTLNEAGVREVVEAHLRSCIDAGIDEREAAIRDVYDIAIQIDPANDRIECGSNCNNNGLREGIVQQFLASLK